MTNHLLHKKFWRAALAGSCFFFAGCENDPKDIDAWTRDAVMVEEGKNIETIISQGGQSKARVTAPYMLRYQSDSTYVEFPQTLKVDFYNATGVVESHLDSRYGKLYETQNRVLLRDSVIVFNFKGDTLQTPELWWDQTSQKIYTDKPVRIRKGRDLIFGIGMNADQDLSNITITKVTGILMVPEGMAAQ